MPAKLPTATERAAEVNQASEIFARLLVTRANIARQAATLVQALESGAQADLAELKAWLIADQRATREFQEATMH